MANGFVPNLLGSLPTLMGANYGGFKISPYGFLKALLQNNPNLNVSGVNGERIDPLKLTTNVSGQVREVKVKYLPRATEASVTEEDTCETNKINEYLESEITAPRVAQYAFFLDYNTVRRYEAGAAQVVQLGNPNIPVVQEVMTQIMSGVNAIISKIDGRLLGDVVWGANFNTQNNLTKDVNINKNGTVFDLTEGMIDIMADYQANEFFGQPIIVGSGLFNNYMLARPGVSANQSGFNMAAFNDFRWYYDVKAQTEWGTNEIGVFAPGSIGIVDISKYLTFESGEFGTSDFGTIMLPVETVPGGAPVMWTFAIQVKEVDCPSEHVHNYTSVSTGRGLEIYIRKHYGLWQQPIDMYADGDRLNNVNGALSYRITNECVNCD